MQYGPKCFACSPRTDFGPSCAPRSRENGATSSGTYRLAVEPTPRHVLFLACLLLNPRLSLLTANLHALCPVDSTVTRRSSSAPRFAHYPAPAFRGVIDSALVAQREGTGCGREEAYATNDYGAGDGAA